MRDRRSILVADGPKGFIPDLSRKIRDLGFELLLVQDAAYVLTMALRHKPAAAVLGAHLPAGGSATALRRLRASVHTASVPVVVIAAPGPDKQAMLSLGAEVCLEPPVAEADLLGALRDVLGLARQVTHAPAEIIRDPARLSALAETRYMDSEPDEALDLITRLAAEILSAPVALVSLVDDTRQFFKSHIGLPSPWDARRQTPLSHSFCQWVVSGQEELVVSDARLHPVLSANRAVSEIGVIAYAGVPLASVTGEPIGSFCAVDGKPRDWSDDDLAVLRILGQLVDAHTALGWGAVVGRQVTPGEMQGIARATGQGFSAAARLLRRGRPALSAEQRDLILGIVERHGYQLAEIVATVPVSR